VKVKDTFAHAFMKDMLAGGISGAIAKTLTAPMERVKLLIQTQDEIPTIIYGDLQKYNGIIDCFIRVFKEQGFMSFWRGNTANIVRYFPTAAFNFAFKDSIKALFPKYDPTNEFMMFFMCNIASGGLAGACALFFVYPLDFVRTRLAADVGKDEEDREFKGSIDCIMKIVNKGGVFAIYQGFGVSVQGIIVYRGGYFGLYDTAKRLMENAGQTGFIARFILAQVVTTLAGVFAYPFDTVRRRLMMTSGSKSAAAGSTREVVMKMYRNEGIGAFYKGCLSNILRGVGSALVLVFYDEIKDLFT